MFRAMETDILPGLINRARAGNRHLRIWSAACSSGEEPYSIAILLHKLIPDLKDWRITLLATDINPVFLQKAETGVYSEWSFRDTPKWVKDHYFSCENGSNYRISPWIKKMVTFSHLNLAKDSFSAICCNTSAMNLIFCRNVLMYFEPEQARSVIGNLHRSLVEGGLLAVSPCDVSQEGFRLFTLVSFDGAMIYRKGDRSSLTIDHSDFHDPVSAPPAESVFNSGSQSTAGPAFSALLPEPDSPSSVFQDDPVSPIPETDDYTRARIFYDQGLYSEAAGLLIKSVSENADLGTITLLARSLSNQGKLDEARLWCEKAAAMDKLNPDLHYLLALVLIELEQMDTAVLSLKRTLYLDPDFVLAHFTLANIHRSADRIKESIKHFQNALELLNGVDPDLDLSGSAGMTAGRLKEMIMSTCLENKDG